MSESIFNEAFTEGIAFPNEESELIDVLKGTPAQLKSTMMNHYEPNKIRQQTSFNAVVLSVLKDEQIGKEKILRVKARIPEIHCLIPIPTQRGGRPAGANDFKDFSTISLYPTFIGQKEQLIEGAEPGKPGIGPGSHIEVSFDNMSNYAAGKILRVFGLVTANIAGVNKSGGFQRFALAAPTPVPLAANIRKGPRVIVPCFQANCQDYRIKALHDPQRVDPKPAKRCINFVPSGPGVRNQSGHKNGKLCSNNPIISKNVFRNRRKKFRGIVTPSLIVIHAGSYTMNHTVGCAWCSGKKAAAGSNEPCRASANYEIFHDGTIYEYFPPGPITETTIDGERHGGLIADWPKFSPEAFKVIKKEFKNGCNTRHAGAPGLPGCINCHAIGIDLTLIGKPFGLPRKGGKCGLPRGHRPFPTGTWPNTGLTRQTGFQQESLRFLISKLCKTFNIPNVGMPAHIGSPNGGTPKGKKLCEGNAFSRVFGNTAVAGACLHAGIGVIQHLNNNCRKSDLFKTLDMRTICDKVYTGPFPITKQTKDINGGSGCGKWPGCG